MVAAQVVAAAALEDTAVNGEDMQTQPATESQLAVSLGGSPSAPAPATPSSMASSAGKLAEQEVICLQIGSTYDIYFSPHAT